MNNQEVDFAQLNRDSLAEFIKNEGEDFANAFIVKPEENMRHKALREDVFTNVFLPMFQNLMFGTSVENKYNMKLGNWITFAGSMTAKVNVVDTVGKLLFVVPAVIDHMKLQPGIVGQAQLDGERLPTIEHVIKQFQLYANSSAIQGDRYLGQELLKRQMHMKNEVQPNAAYIDAWNQVFAHYKLPLLGAPKTAAVADTVTDEGETDYEFVAP